MTGQCLDKWQPKDTYLGSPELPECWQESAGYNPGPSALLGYNIIVSSIENRPPVIHIAHAIQYMITLSYIYRVQHTSQNGPPQKNPP